MPTVLASFLASAVEATEALTVVLAVGTVRGWRAAIGGVVAAVLVLLVAVLAGGATLDHVPLTAFRLVVGTLLVLFGLRWLQKAILRAAGIVPVRDETASFGREVTSLRTSAPHRAGWDALAFGTAFNIVLLEGAEVVFVVVAIGAGGTGSLLAAGVGATAALVLVMALGAVLRRPLSHVPENELKFVVGLVLTAFGTFWFGEGVGVAWPGGEVSLPGLVAGYLVAAAVAARLCRALVRHSARNVREAVVGR